MEELYEGDWDKILAPRLHGGGDSTAAAAAENWQKVRRNVGIAAAVGGVLETVRGRQAEKLYDQDWCTPASQAYAAGACLELVPATLAAGAQSTQAGDDTTPESLPTPWQWSESEGEGDG